MEDLSTILTFEVKKDIADRYFGFRKIIEEDSQLYRQNIISLSLELETSIGFDLVRIYTLLQDDDLVHDFFATAGLPERLFFDSYINKSPAIRKRVLLAPKVHGLTRKSRFMNMFFDTYSVLYDHIIEYRSTLCQLIEDHETILEQINLFYRKNDITGIMQFLRNIDRYSARDSGPLEAPPPPNSVCNLDDKLRLNPPDPVEDLIPIIPAIPQLKDVRSQLKTILTTAWSRRPGLDLREM
jgi:hypothetical protein